MATASNRIRLVLFVLAGLAVLIVTLVLLGKRQNLFGSSLAVQADFRNVSGLLTGNNVRLAGITVGTVKKINILNDSTVRVVMHLNRDVQPYVRKNAVASVGTDGLVGNTIVNLTAVPAPAPLIADGDILRTSTPPAIDEMLKTLSVSKKTWSASPRICTRLRASSTAAGRSGSCSATSRWPTTCARACATWPAPAPRSRPRPTTSGTSRAAFVRAGGRPATC
jgi:ABC-type transporter Mla subunit MlaD